MCMHTCMHLCMRIRETQINKDVVYDFPPLNIHGLSVFIDLCTMIIRSCDMGAVHGEHG